MNDDQKHEKVKTPQEMDEGSIGGTMSDPEQVESEDTLDQAHDMGLYQEADEEHPVEIGIKTN